MKKSMFAVLTLSAAWSLPLLAAGPQVLTSTPTTTPPAIDGNAEGAWDSAKALKVTVNKLPYKPNNGYEGMKSTEVTLRALHDKEHFYMLVQYTDPQESIERFPWVKQGDGSWKQKSNKDSTGHDNTYYEDKFAILWDINARGFAKKGCDAACHVAKDGKVNGIVDKSPGRKFTSKPGQTIDMWHWKSVRSNPVDQVDDQFIDSTADPKANKNWGRKGDSKPGGGYKNNVSEDKKSPLWMAKDASSGGYWLMANNKVDFVDEFKAGDIVPGIVVSPFEGSRGDIEAKGVWKDGMWTIEMKRKLVTTGDKADEQDVQFDDMGKSYSFGVSVFDNSQINHIYHEGVLQLKFAE